MTKIDQFESVFKSAERNPFAHEKIEFSSGVVVSDLGESVNAELTDWIQRAIQAAMGVSSTWTTIDRSGLNSVDGLLQEVQRIAPDLICTFRNLTTPLQEHPYSLGVFLDVLAQATDVPVLVLPRPESEPQFRCPNEIRNVMVITDHLAGQHHMVSIGAAITPPNGTLWLSHVEAEATFERYIEAIGKIPEIDTDSARELILAQLLKEPADYIESCKTNLKTVGELFQVEKKVMLGHRLNDYKELVEEHNVDLLVMNTKDEDQQAMHGLAYPLSIELRDTPLLML